MGLIRIRVIITAEIFNAAISIQELPMGLDFLDQPPPPKFCMDLPNTIDAAQGEDTQVSASSQAASGSATTSKPLTSPGLGSHGQPSPPSSAEEWMEFLLHMDSSDDLVDPLILLSKDFWDK